jgi:hypothetical protein
MRSGPLCVLELVGLLFVLLLVFLVLPLIRLRPGLRRRLLACRWRSCLLPHRWRSRSLLWLVRRTLRRWSYLALLRRGYLALALLGWRDNRPLLGLIALLRRGYLALLGWRSNWPLLGLKAGPLLGRSYFALLGWRGNWPLLGLIAGPLLGRSYFALLGWWGNRPLLRLIARPLLGRGYFPLLRWRAGPFLRNVRRGSGIIVVPVRLDGTEVLPVLLRRRVLRRLIGPYRLLEGWPIWRLVVLCGGLIRSYRLLESRPIWRLIVLAWR